MSFVKRDEFESSNCDDQLVCLVGLLQVDVDDTLTCLACDNSEVFKCDKHDSARPLFHMM